MTRDTRGKAADEQVVAEDIGLPRPSDAIVRLQASSLDNEARVGHGIKEAKDDLANEDGDVEPGKGAGAGIAEELGHVGVASPQLYGAMHGALKRGQVEGDELDAKVGEP